MAVLSTARPEPAEAASPAPRVGDYVLRTFDALGTVCRIVLAGGSRAAADRVLDDAVAWLARFEARYSRYRPDSLVSRVNAAAGGDWVETDAETDSLLALCDAFHWRTRGVFDPSALPLTRLWDYTVPDPSPPQTEAIRRALACVGWAKVKHEPGRIRLPEAGMAIDLGGIGKEYAVDRIAGMAASAGLRHVLVDLGRDIRAIGRAPGGDPWRVGLEDPSDPGQCWTGIAVRDRAVATSGDYARGFTWNGRRYGHILDPRTGYPPEHACQAVTVIAPSCTEAGILAKTAFILGPDEGLRLLNVTPQVEGFMWARGARLQTTGAGRYAMTPTEN